MTSAGYIFRHKYFNNNAQNRADGADGGRLPPPQLVQRTVYVAIYPHLLASETARTMPIIAKGSMHGTITTPYNMRCEVVVERTGRPFADVRAQVVVTDRNGNIQSVSSTAVGDADNLVIVVYRVEHNRITLFVNNHPPEVTYLTLYDPPTTIVEFEQRIALANTRDVHMAMNKTDDTIDLDTAYDTVNYFGGHIALIEVFPEIQDDGEIGATVSMLHVGLDPMAVKGWA